MRKRSKIAENIEEVKQEMNKAKSKRIFQRLQSVYLADTQPDLTASDIANIVRLSTHSVKMIHSNFRRNGMSSIVDKRGGRYREYMTVDEEKAFLKPFEEKSKTGSII